MGNERRISLYPTGEQIQKLLASGARGPVVMVNLLRFRAEAGEPDAGLSGEEAYRRYADKMIAFVESKGGRVIWSGRLLTQVIGEGGDTFHMVGLVEYPSIQAFAAMTSEPYVQEIGVHRAAGLEGQWLLAASATTS